MGKILLYTNDNNKADKIKNLCVSLKHDFARISANQLDYAVLSLAVGMPLRVAGVRIPPMYTQKEIMIFSGLRDKELDIFLEKYRQAGIEKMPLKAIITPFNCKWSVYELTAELIKENKALG